MPARIILDVILCIGLFLVPPWLLFLVAILGLFYFGNFYEILLLGIAIDVFYGVPLYFMPIPVLYSLLSGLLFIAIVVILRKHLKFY